MTDAYDHHEPPPDPITPFELFVYILAFTLIGMGVVAALHGCHEAGHDRIRHARPKMWTPPAAEQPTCDEPLGPLALGDAPNDR